MPFEIPIFSRYSEQIFIPTYSEATLSTLKYFTNPKIFSFYTNTYLYYEDAMYFV